MDVGGQTAYVRSWSVADRLRVEGLYNSEDALLVLNVFVLSVCDEEGVRQFTDDEVEVVRNSVDAVTVLAVHEAALNHNKMFRESKKNPDSVTPTDSSAD